MAIDEKPYAPVDLSVLISGAGIGGLLAALELLRRGCRVRLLERAKANQMVGDSFTLSATAVQALNKWPELMQRNREIKYDVRFSYRDQRGECIGGPIDINAILPAKRDDDDLKPEVFMHSRPKFHAALLEQLEKEGLQVEYGKEVVAYFDEEAESSAGVRLADGSELRADLVIAADGARGHSTELINPDAPPARSSGHAIFRVAYPVEIALADPVIAERFPLCDEGRTRAELWMGPDMMCTFFRSHDRMQWALNRPDPGTAQESWGHRVDPEEAVAYAETIPGFPDVAKRVMRATPPGMLVDWKLMWRDPQSTWVSPGGRVVQLGDAAHTFLPASGNGANQALEDATSLAACLAVAAARGDDVAHATRVHNLLRFERVSCLQAFGVANTASRNTKHVDLKDKKHEVHFGKWMFFHNPEKYAYENYAAARAHLVNGEPFQNTNIPPGMVYKPWTIEGLLDAQKRGEQTVLDGDWS